MAQADEIDVLQFFKTIIEAGITANAGVVIGWDEGWIEDDLTVENKRILYASRAKVNIDPDEEFNIVDTNGVSTSAILLEIADTIATTNSVQGNMIYGLNTFNILIIVAKNNRSYADYGRELSAIKNFILNVFVASTGKRIQVESISWSNFMVGQIPGSGCVIKIRTSINNYDYQIT